MSLMMHKAMQALKNAHVHTYISKLLQCQILDYHL